MTKYVEDIMWNDAEVEVHFYFTKGYEARLWGAPEDCYPGEDDEWDIEKIMYKDVNVSALFSQDDYERVIEILDRKRNDD